MKRIEKEQLEALLASKPYSALTPEERYFVTEIVGEEEYERMRFLTKNATPLLRDMPPPDPAIKENLLAAMRQMKTESKDRKPVIVRLLKTRIPAWQVAAAICLLLGVHFLFPNEGPVKVLTETEYVYQTDTIYKEVAISMPPPTDRIDRKQSSDNQIRINMKPQEPTLVFRDEPSSTSPDEALSSVNLRSDLADTFALTVSQPRGQSANQTEDLMQFFGEVY